MKSVRTHMAHAGNYGWFRRWQSDVSKQVEKQGALAYEGPCIHWGRGHLKVKGNSPQHPNQRTSSWVPGGRVVSGTAFLESVLQPSGREGRCVLARAPSDREPGGTDRSYGSSGTDQEMTERTAHWKLPGEEKTRARNELAKKKNTQ